jgi:phosphoribosylformylglycinamidine synthase PurS subunit
VVIFNAHLVVTLKPVVNDPQGLVVQSGLRQLGFESVDNVRVGKYIELTVDAADEATAREQVVQMCEKLLRNPVIEDYDIKRVAAATADHEPHHAAAAHR